MTRTIKNTYNKGTNHRSNKIINTKIFIFLIGYCSQHTIFGIVKKQ